MNIDFDEIGKKLHEKLDSSINGLKTMKAQLEDLQKETEAAIHTKLTVAKETVEEKKQEAAATKTRLETLIDEKKAETETAVAEWQTNRDRKKLEKRAERAEKYADVCVEMVLSAALQAEVAILEAVAARRDADSAAK
ncbi:MAG: hypothetical protein ACI8PB_004677 [Desulforhopalus sp.]|jgi:hypothetical protein